MVYNSIALNQANLHQPQTSWLGLRSFRVSNRPRVRLPSTLARTYYNLTQRYLNLINVSSSALCCMSLLVAFLLCMRSLLGFFWTRTHLSSLQIQKVQKRKRLEANPWNLTQSNLVYISPTNHIVYVLRSTNGLVVVRQYAWSVHVVGESMLVASWNARIQDPRIEIPVRRLED